MRDGKERILQTGVDAGARLYKALRWTITIGFGLATALVAYSSKLMPDLAAAVLSFGLAIAGFWFVPELLDKPMNRIARWRYRSVVADKDSTIVVPEKSPNFRRGNAST